MSNMLEPEFAPHYQAWNSNRSPETAAGMLKALGPTIDSAIQAHVGPSDPLIKSKARRMALEGLVTYDPSKGKLKTHLMSHMQGLKRVARKQNTILSVPERVSLNRSHVENASKEFEAVNGREPSDAELADHSGLSVDRIRSVRRYKPAVAEGQFEDVMPVHSAIKGALTPFHKMIYHELEPTDQSIFDLTLRGVSNQAVAAKLRLSPGAVSQRKAKIQSLLDREEELSPF